MQTPVDPVSKLPGLLQALTLMDAAVQQNLYHDKLLMYRDVRRPEPDKVMQDVGCLCTLSHLLLQVWSV